MRRLALVVASVLLSSCHLLGGGADTLAEQVELIGLVQRVALTPGVDALDPSGPTAMGTDWRVVEYTFTEPIAPESAAAFSAAVNLELSDGLRLDPERLPRFNEQAIGLIPARTRLVLWLLPMSEGTHSIKLISPSDAPLRGQSGSEITGSFRLRATVFAKDGHDPRSETAGR